MMRKMLVASSGFRGLQKEFEAQSLDARLSWLMASDSKAGERNKRGTVSGP
jgi:hypothetical protein